MALSTYSSKREGIGSLFHNIDEKEYQFNKVAIDFDYLLFYTGRQAFKYILDTICSEHDIDKIWMPNYYCQHVTRWIKKIYNNLHFYDIDPFEFTHPIDLSSFASSKDIVLINNYWGLSDSFAKNSNGPIIVEDHSHGWLTNNCMHSQADYCFVSLRKTLPIPLGGICWQPNSKIKNNANRFLEDPSFYTSFDMLFEAMNAKKRYNNGISGIDKNAFLKVMEDTEDYLDKNQDIIKLRTQDDALLSNYLNINFLEKKETNLNLLYNHLSQADCMKVVKRKNYTAFGLTLLFKNKKNWKSLQSHLINYQIYPSYLWPDNTLNQDWCYVLNVHVDFRYNKNDMMYIIDCINNWIKMSEN
jgi:hypothetical protein